MSFVVLACISCSAGLQTNKQNESNGKLRLGYLLNMTHAVPIIGLEDNRFTDVVGLHFVAGGYLISSLITGNIDVAYVGPGPFVNAITKDIDLVVLAVSANGANSLVLSKEFAEKKYPDAAHAGKQIEISILGIKKLGVPQLGNTQDLLARILFRGSEKAPEYIAINPAEIETAFYTKAIEAAFVSEPWGTILASKGAKLVQSNGIDEINKYPTTLLIVHKPYYEANRDKVNRFVQEQNLVLDFIKSQDIENQSKVRELIKKHFKKLAQKDLTDEFVADSLARVIFADGLDKVDLAQLGDLMDVSYKSTYIRRKADIEQFINVKLM